MTIHGQRKPDPATSAVPSTLPGLFGDAVRTRGSRVALREKDFGIWEEVTWAAYGERVRACAFGLIACGLEPGERVAILSEDRREWLYADLGCQCAGGVSVGLYVTESAERVGYIVGHAEARIWVVEDQEQFDKAMAVRDQLPELRQIVVIDPKGLRHVDDSMVITFDQLLDQGAELERVRPDLLDERLAAIDPDDTVILFYTSGTTGTPKGVMHSHRSLLAGAQAVLGAFPTDVGDEALCYGPLCHLAERLFSLLLSLRCGHTVNFAEGPDTVFADLREVAPTVFFGVPRTWERLKARVDIEVAEATWSKRQAFWLASSIGRRRCETELQGGSPSLWLKVAWAAADLLVIGKLRKRLGLNRVRDAGVAAAPVAPEIIATFRSLGVPLRELYGQTETAALTVATPADGVRLGKQGVVLPGVEYRIDAGGEIWWKCAGLMQGYLKNPEATAAELVDGWFRSGDIGDIDDDGYLHLTGRAKDMIVTSGGRNVAPQGLENMLKASDYILDAVVVGDGRDYLTALIALDEETTSHYAQRHGIPFASHADLAGHAEIHRLIDAEVQGVNRRWSDREQIVDFRLLRWELHSDDDELTPTLKVRRAFLIEQHAELIEEMYADP